MVEQCRPQTTIWRMRVSCWIPEATDTHSEYVISIAFPLPQRLHERASMWRYTYIGCLAFTLFLPVLQLINLLKPIGHVMHRQFNIQQLYALPTLYLCVLYLSENKQRLVPLTV